MLDDPAAAPETTVQWRWLQDVMAGAGMDGRYAVLVDGGRRCLGLDRAELERRARGAALVSVMGSLDDATLLAGAARRVFGDIDPGVPPPSRGPRPHGAFAAPHARDTGGA